MFLQQFQLPLQVMLHIPVSSLHIRQLLVRSEVLYLALIHSHDFAQVIELLIKEGVSLLVPQAQLFEALLQPLKLLVVIEGDGLGALVLYWLDSVVHVFIANTGSQELFTVLDAPEGACLVVIDLFFEEGKGFIELFLVAIKILLKGA